MLTTDIYTDFFTQCVEFFCDLTGCFLTCTGICDHHHVEVAIQDSLCDIKDIHLIICQISTNFCNDSYSIFWSELLRAGYKVKKSGIQSIGIAGKRETELTNLYWIMMYSSGGNLNTVSEELWEKCFQNFRQLSVGELTSRYATNFTQEDLAQEFAEGRVTMMINQMSVTSILKSNQPKFTVGMAEVPYDEAGGTFWFGDEVCVTKEAGTGAVSFAQYLIKKEISERINDTMGTLQVYTGISYKKKGKIYMEDTNNLSARARPMLYYQSWSDICGEIASGVSSVLNSNLSDVSLVAEKTRDQIRVSIMSDS